ncbi:Glycosyltransferase involved in cell wall bisynthesis [Roseateles sp. YR242]|uniref:glycosyltransferase family 4 protein n=1 Tax=Roseateles sp. YR242 TaxID=1855305 RepID=UPI0008CE0321|nr:glycosyltransferase family 4 protein [Roseateles sp. YR242]SEL19466.1 Glycosyltransferase involved in cell wall bisynthesis [Roseateles sp. YR242]
MNKPASLHRVDNPAHRLHVVEVVGDGIVGGMGRGVERLVAHLSQSGRFRFTVLCPFEGDFTERVRAAGAEVVIVPMPEDPPWQAIQMVTGLVRQRQVGLLHVHLPNAHQLGGLVGRITGVPVMATIHSRKLTMPDLEAHRMVGSHLSMECQHSYLHAVGLGIDPDKLSCDPHGVDTQAFQPGPRPVEGLRQRFDLSEDSLLVGLVGRLSPEKAPDRFLRAVALLHERMPDVHVMVVGEGPLRPQLIEAAQRQGLLSHVHFTGRIDDMAPVYHDLDLLVSSSEAEATPLALMEGMASGLAVVATRAGGVPEFVEHGRSGWLVAPKDDEDMAMRMHQMLTVPDLRQRMGARARASMEERHPLGPRLDALAQRMRQLARPRAVTAEPRRMGGPPRVVTSRGEAVAQALHQPVQAAGTPDSVVADLDLAVAPPVPVEPAAAMVTVAVLDPLEAGPAPAPQAPDFTPAITSGGARSAAAGSGVDRPALTALPITEPLLSNQKM